ncbi:MAG: hypothetical protein BGO98_35260 [Myxococcales bacterium 68-20]|nr:MAG: hypothetical protein BGO98_35260 [Myxococcales bacterium 68-20]
MHAGRELNVAIPSRCARTQHTRARLGRRREHSRYRTAQAFWYATVNGVVEQPSWFVEPRVAFFAALRIP